MAVNWNATQLLRVCRSLSPLVSSPRVPTDDKCKSVLEFVRMTAREHDFHGLSCVLFGGSCVPLVVVVVLFTCTFLVSPGGSCVRFWWCCILVKDSSASTDHVSRKSKLESSAAWPLHVPATRYPDFRLDLSAEMSVRYFFVDLEHPCFFEVDAKA